MTADDPKAHADHIACRVTYRGRVQGVGFRFTALEFAHTFPAVTGYVRNLPDGDVEVLAEGPRGDVNALLEAVAHGPHERFIRQVTAEPVVPTGSFSSFDVTY